MKHTMGFVSMLLLVCIQGCLPAQRVQPVKPPGSYDASVISYLSNDINMKIDFLNTVLKDNNIPETDRKIALDLLNTYKQLQKMSHSPSENTAYPSVIHKLFSALSLIDERYFNLSLGDPPKIISQFSEKRGEIIDAYLSEDYQKVIDLCIELKAAFGPDALTPDVGVVFALSLSKIGMLDEAITIGEGVAQRLEPYPDLILLRIRIAEWYLQQGQQEKAINIYEKLSDTVNEKGIEARFLSRKIAASERFMSGMGKTPGKEHKQIEGATADQILEKVGNLLEENRFAEARDMLFAKKGEHLSPSDKEKIDRALKKIQSAEEDYLEKKISMISIKRDMEQARQLLEEERLEEVISRLEAIEEREGEDREITELKTFAIEKLVNRERNRAAQIFLLAKKTKDRGKKEDYLLECLDILNKLVDKYPISTLNQKLISNIETVTEELETLRRNRGRIELKD